MARLDEHGERIPLTVADFNAGQGTVTVVIQAVGKTTIEMMALREGDFILDFVGPLGLPSHIRELDGTVVLVGGGLGVAPIFPQLREYKNAGNRTISIVGFRNRDLMFWEDQFREFSDELIVTTDVGPRVIRCGFVGADNEFKSEVIERSTRAGLVSMVTWEPWLSSFRRGAVLDPDSCMVHVVHGEFDAYIKSWARAVARSRNPVLLRPMHELGNPWYAWSSPNGNDPNLQIEAWRHIVGIFRSQGARNAAFVWTPYDALDTLAWPGGEWVDWVGLDVFNYGDMEHENGWLDFKRLLEHQLEPVRHFGKPVILVLLGGSAIAVEWKLAVWPPGPGR